MGSTPKVPSFNDIASHFDPLMPEEDYEKLRSKYYNDFVLPRLPHGTDALVAYRQFKELTKRPEVLTPGERALTRAGLFATSAAQEILGPVTTVPGVKKLHDSIAEDQAAMEVLSKREGIHPGRYTVPGQMTGLAVDWELLAPYAGQIAEGVAARALEARRAQDFMARVAKGSLTFATIEAASDQTGNRLTAGLKGATLGAAFETPFALVGLLKAGGLSEAASKKIVQDAMEGKPIPEAADKLLSKAVSDNAAAAKAQGRPDRIVLNPSLREAYIEATAADGKTTIKIPIKPLKESIAIKQAASLVENGGQIEAIHAHPDSMNFFNRFMGMYQKQFGFDDYKAIRTIRVKGDAGKAAEALATSGTDAKSVKENVVTVDKPVSMAPTKPGYTTSEMVDMLMQEKSPVRGSGFSKPEVIKAVDTIERIWDPSVPEAWKQKNLGAVPFEGNMFLPSEWREAHRNIFSLDIEAEASRRLTEDGGGARPIFSSAFNRPAEPGNIPTIGEVAKALDERVGPIRSDMDPTDPVLLRRREVEELLEKAWDSSYPPGMKVGLMRRLKPDFEDMLPNRYRATEAELEMAKAQGVKIEDVDLDKLREVGIENVERAREVVKTTKVRESKTFFDAPSPQAFAIPTSEVISNISWKKGTAKMIQRPGGFLQVELPGKIWNDLFGNVTKAAAEKGGQTYGAVEFKSGHELMQYLSDNGVVLRTPAGDLTKPAYLFPKSMHGPLYAKGIHYHEQMHALVDNTVGKLMANHFGEGIDTAWMIGKALPKEMPEVYSSLSPRELMEEAFAYGSQAIRTGDRELMAKLVKWDTSAEHVRQMVTSTAQNLLNDMKGDGMQMRILQRRLEDLVRRGAPERMYQMRRAIGITGEIPYTEGDKYVLHGPNGQRTVFDTVDQLMDHLEAHDNVEWVPNPSARFEMAGFSPQFSTTRAVRDVPTTPDTGIDYLKDKWAGLAGLSGVWRPFIPWVAGIDEKINKMLALRSSTQRFPIYNAVRRVDDMIRAGDTWITNARESYVNILKGISSDRQDDLFEALTVKPEFQKQIMDKLNFTAKEREAIPRIEEWLNNYRNETGINAWNYLRDELQRLRGFGFSADTVYGTLEKDPKKMSFWHRMIEEQKWDPRDTHLGRFVNLLVREGFEKKFTAEPLADLEKMVNLTVKKGDETRYFLGPMRWPLQNYVNYVKGIPDMSQQVINRAVGDFTGHLTDQFKKVNAMLPKGIAKLPEEALFPQGVVNRFIMLSYAAGLGLRPAIALRDSMQAFMTALPVLGPAKFSRAFLKMFRGGFEQAEREGALLSKNNIGELYNDIFREMPPDAGDSFATRLNRFSNAMLSPSRWGHNVGRAIAYIAEYDSALEAINKYRAGGIDAGRLIKDTSLWFNDKPRITQLLNLAGDRSVEAKDVAKMFAREVNDLTQWPYRRGTQPAYLRTGMGRIFGQYGMWPMNYFDFMMRMTKKVAEHPDKALPAVGIWAATNYAAVQTFEAMGADTGKWWFFSPATPVPIGSPHWQMIQAASKSLENSSEGREARRTVLEYPLQFVPNVTELKAIMRTIEEDDLMKEGRGFASPGFLRIMGMRPMPEIEKDKEWADWIQWQMGMEGTNPNVKR